jgi:hypothetical protein
MKLTIYYASSRAEIWRFYWRAWKGGLWLKNLKLSVMIAFFTIVFSAAKHSLADLNIGFLLLAMMTPQFFNLIFPQLMFKRQTRTLTIDENGWQSTIGKKTGAVAWTDVQGVEKFGDTILISGITGNALVVPQRAFQSIDKQDEFLAFAVRSHAEANS